MSQPLYLQQNNQVDDARFYSIILVEPTPNTQQCISCGVQTKINQDMHCIACAEKNKAFNKLMARSAR